MPRIGLGLGPTTLACLLLEALLALALPSNALALNEPVVFCGSPLFERLMSTPVRAAQQDLSLALWTLDQLVVRDDFFAPKCSINKYRGLSPQTALRVHIERRWMDDVTGADVQEPATI